MIVGRFGDIGELLFDIDLITAQGEPILVEALLDTGFTTGWLAMAIQDALSLGWVAIELDRAMQTARGKELFDIYEGKVIFGEQELLIPVHVSEGIPEIILGLQWLETRRLIVDKSVNLLTLQ